MSNVSTSFFVESNGVVSHRLPTEPPADFYQFADLTMSDSAELFQFNDADWFELGLEIQKGYQEWIQNPIDYFK